MNILLVDDDRDSRKSVGKFLRKIGHQVDECSSGEEALEVYSRGDYPMVLTDIRMPGISGTDLLKAIRNMGDTALTEIVLFTGHGTVESAIEALRMGAFDYLLKPINIQELAVVVEKVAEHQSLRRENNRLTHKFEEEVQAATKEVAEEVERLREIVSQATGIHEIGIYSTGLKEIFHRAQLYNQDRSIPVLIQGETGTGKELIAKLIHYGKMGTTAPFIDLNCAALTPSLFESELFGYEAGSFTGSIAKGQKGKLDLAAGGTLFLDEIGEMPLEMQAKILRIIQEKEYYRVGGLKKIKTDVRIVCATNVNLHEAVAKGMFRKDLYYRLNVGQIHIPPLREHSESIIPLAEMFLERFAQEKGKVFCAIANDAAQVLLAHSWPGNVRELQNVIEWSTFMYNEPKLCASHLKIAGTDSFGKEVGSVQEIRPQEEIKLPSEPFVLNDYIDKIILTALQRFGGNRSVTADYLGLSRRALSYRADRLINKM